MAVINVLPKQVAELIAAGEVVERPSSVIKELVENSIDAKATLITVEIKNGGVTFMRVTDNGSGIAREDVATAFLRHATSKVSVESDLEAIMTLGFRGEALAAISSVSKVELLTKTQDSETGTLYLSEGGGNISVNDAGCPNGTTIIIRDLFFNTPARMKFLKKDVAEGNSVATIMEHIALSHPEISFKFIRDGKNIFTTAGDGKLMSAIYAVLGRQFAATLIPVEGELGGIKVSGYVCKPSECRPKKNAQFVFLNGRYVRSGTVAAALDAAYKNLAMVGRFPAGVLHLSVPYGAVDINVHPAKTEVRFSDEKRVFDSVMFSVKNAIAAGDERPEMKLKQRGQIRMSAEEYRQSVIPDINKTKSDPIASFTKMIETSLERIDKAPSVHSSLKTVNNEHGMVSDKEKVEPKKSYFHWYDDSKNETDDGLAVLSQKMTYKSKAVEEIEDVAKQEPKPIEKSQEEKQIDEIIPETEYIGEAFSTYIIVRREQSLFLIDKHAAHERILYNELKTKEQQTPQLLLSPEQVMLKYDEHEAIIENIDLLEKVGFEVDDFGDNSVLVRSIPAFLSGENVKQLLLEVAANLLSKNMAEISRMDRIYETVACRSAVKAGNLSSPKELKELADKVLSSKEIMYCPHGRPVAIELKKSEIEKQFGRIQ